MEISISAALMPNVSGKILVCKQWGLGYQRFNGNKNDKKHKNAHQNTYKEIQNDQIKKDDITSIKNMFTNLSPA